MTKRVYKCTNPECDNPKFENFSETPEEVTCAKCNSKCIEIIKKKSNAGRPKRDIAKDKADKLPPNWRDITLELASKGCSDVEIEAHFMKFNGLKAANVDAMCRALEANDVEFKTTLKNAHKLCQAWWEGIAKKKLYHSKDMVFETGSWFANMKNRFGWKDKTDIEHSMPDNLLEKFANLSGAELKGKIAELIGKA